MFRQWCQAFPQANSKGREMLSQFWAVTVNIKAQNYKAKATSTSLKKGPLETPCFEQGWNSEVHEHAMMPGQTYLKEVLCGTFQACPSQSFYFKKLKKKKTRCVIMIWTLMSFFWWGACANFLKRCLVRHSSLSLILNWTILSRDETVGFICMLQYLFGYLAAHTQMLWGITSTEWKVSFGRNLSWRIILFAVLCSFRVSLLPLLSICHGGSSDESRSSEKCLPCVTNLTPLIQSQWYDQVWNNKGLKRISCESVIHTEAV